MTSTVAADPSVAAKRFHALSDVTRLEIVDMLSSGERCVCDLTSALDAAQSRLSFHLKVLRDAGIVLDRRRGRWVYYSLNKECLEEISGFFSSLEPRRTLPVAAADGCCE
jgi:ArsR family transcriptional regulator